MTIKNNSQDESAKRGFLVVHRDLWDDLVFKPLPESERGAWLWLMKEAAYTDRVFWIGDVCYDLQRGQLVHSYGYIAEKLIWLTADGKPNAKAAERFLKRLAARGRIMMEPTKGGFKLISIVGYDESQLASGYNKGASSRRGVEGDGREKPRSGRANADLLSRDCQPPVNKQKSGNAGKSGNSGDSRNTGKSENTRDTGNTFGSACAIDDPDSPSAEEIHGSANIIPFRRTTISPEEAHSTAESISYPPGDSCELTEETLETLIPEIFDLASVPVAQELAAAGGLSYLRTVVERAIDLPRATRYRALAGAARFMSDDWIMSEDWNDARSDPNAGLEAGRLYVADLRRRAEQKLGANCDFLVDRAVKLSDCDLDKALAVIEGSPDIASFKLAIENLAARNAA
ncbi:hypothetical protein [Bradyrhizobium sp. dw_78]|uniref:hypothetical protein n=1 Tax=Bradyrhizobium sp. dw_78 TaxID=2719793 RepID=UPI001BD5FC56|nr:hypothetical protein [Bradyrhizobium sp. dw_78]